MIASTQICYFAIGIFHSFISVSEADLYIGRLISEFSEETRGGLRGKIWAADPWKIYLQNFSYDGAIGENAYFRVGPTPTVSNSDWKLTWGNSSTYLRRFENENIVLKSPNDLEIPRPIQHLTLWGERSKRVIAQVTIPRGFKYPYPMEFGAQSSPKHNVSMSQVRIRDIKTIKFYDLWYDGLGPAAYFLVGIDSSSKPHGGGTKVPVNNKTEVLKEYRGENVTLKLPGDITFFDVKWISIYCIKFRNNFFHLNIPSKEDLNVPADMSVFADVSKGPIAPVASTSGVIASSVDPFLKGGATNKDGNSDHFQKDQADPPSTDGASVLVSYSSVLLSIVAFYSIKMF